MYRFLESRTRRCKYFRVSHGSNMVFMWFYFYACKSNPSLIDFIYCLLLSVQVKKMNYRFQKQNTGLGKLKINWYTIRMHSVYIDIRIECNKYRAKKWIHVFKAELDYIHLVYNLIYKNKYQIQHVYSGLQSVYIQSFRHENRRSPIFVLHSRSSLR